MSKYFSKDIPLEENDFKDGYDQFQLKSIGDVITKLLRDQKNNGQKGSSIALIGSWGTGKSTLLKYVKGELPDSHKFIFINAWPYDEESLKSVLLREVYYEISNDERVTSNEFYQALKTITAKVREEKDEGTVSGIKSIFLKILPLLIVTAFISIVYSWLISLGTSQSVADVLKKDSAVIFATLFIGSGGLWSFLSYVQKKSDTSIHVSLPTESADYYEHKLKEYIDNYHKKGHDERFIVVIDDLDRLSFESMIQSIETVKVFMDIPQLDVILPFDERIVKNALKETKLKKLYMQEYNLAKYEGFLDKLFQYKFYLPPIKLGHIKNFALSTMDNLEGLKELHIKYGVDMTEVISVLIYSRAETPRQVKKLINSYSSNLQIVLNRVENHNLRIKLNTDEFKVIAFLSTLHSEFGYFYDALVDGSVVMNSNADLKQYIMSSSGKLSSYIKMQNIENNEIVLTEKGKILDNYLSYNSVLKNELISEFLFMSDNIIVRRYGMRANELKDAFVNKNVRADIIEEYLDSKEFSKDKYDSFISDIMDETKGEGDTKAVNNISYVAIMLHSTIEISKKARAYDRIKHNFAIESLNDLEVQNLNVNTLSYYFGKNSCVDFFKKIASVRYNNLAMEIEKNDIEGYDFVDEITSLVEIHRALLDINVIDETKRIVESYSSEEIADDEMAEAISHFLYLLIESSTDIEKLEFGDYDMCIIENTSDINELASKTKLLTEIGYDVDIRVVEYVSKQNMENPTTKKKAIEFVVHCLKHLYIDSIKEKNDYIRTFNKMFLWLQENSITMNAIYDVYGKVKVVFSEADYEETSRSLLDYRENVLQIILNTSFLYNESEKDFIQGILKENTEITSFYDYIINKLIQDYDEANNVRVLDWIDQYVADVSKFLTNLKNQVNRYFIYSDASSGKLNEFINITKLLERKKLVNIINLITNQNNFNQGISNYLKVSEMIDLSSDFVNLDGYEQIGKFWQENTQQIINNSNTDSYSSLLRLYMMTDTVNNTILASLATKINLYFNQSNLVSWALDKLIKDENDRNNEILKIVKYISNNDTEARENFYLLHYYERMVEIILAMSDAELKRGLSSLSSNKIAKLKEVLLMNFSNEHLYQFINVFNKSNELISNELIEEMYPGIIEEYSSDSTEVDFEKIYVFFNIALQKGVVSEKLDDEKFWNSFVLRHTKDDYRGLIDIIKLARLAGLRRKKNLKTKLKNEVYLVTENVDLQNALVEEMNIKK